MEENKKHREGKGKASVQKEEKVPTQPETPVGNITSSDDTARLPDHTVDTPPDEQTKGNP
ncbi:hypothetical protein DXT99_16725 [Pontibacter diazotrophicus]|uniref:Uncharacterized protein n=1 Tax=Pontibacter diazotrophicus TaxID=1400979 RepID=A0A3D8L9A3_9BACT|nr:hypothetical protein [Pontibacter diazotrophicus]RDV13947.1 hypothetical protein DXT99_16725 [Pontibacter diazotrophicus]